MNNAKDRSKIYTYFYGKNTVFQQFLIAVGVLFFLLANIAADANQEGYYKKRMNLYEAYGNAESAYQELYYEYGNSFDANYGEKVSASKRDENYQKRKEYNNALDKYNTAKEKYEKFAAKDSSTTLLGGLSKSIGVFAIVVGVFWILYRKLSFNRDGEIEVDEELLRIIESAKKKGLEKLNIISDQIDQIEPVVLNGVAHTDNVVTSISHGVIGRLLSPLWRFIMLFDKLVLGLIIAGIYIKITSLISSNIVVFILMFFIALCGCGTVGYYIYKKFERESHVSQRTIERLTKFTPNFIAKLGSDENVRVSLPAITIYMFGEDQLYMYYQYVDIVTGRIFYEGVHEYFYEDIVGITSSQEAKKIFKRYGFMKLFLKSIDYLKENITVVTSGCSHQESYIVDVDRSLLDTQFIGMRNLIRQKKAK